MLVSFEDALQLLSKWADESVEIDCLVMTPGTLLVFRAWVIPELRRDFVKFSNPAAPDLQWFLVTLKSAANFQYGDSREASETDQKYLSSIASILVFTTLGDTVIVLLERA